MHRTVGRFVHGGAAAALLFALASCSVAPAPPGGRPSPAGSPPSPTAAASPGSLLVTPTFDPELLRQLGPQTSGARMYFLLGGNKAPEAVSLYRAAVSRKPSDTRSLVRLGFALDAVGEGAEARSILARALEQDASEPLALSLQALLEVQEGRLEEATAGFEKAAREGAVRGDAEAVALALLGKGTCLMWRGDVPGAREAFQEAGEQGTGGLMVRSLVSLALLEEVEGRPREALALLRRASNLVAGYSTPPSLLVNLQIKSGQAEEARRELDSWPKDGRQGQTGQVLRLLLLHSQGKRDEARKLALPHLAPSAFPASVPLDMWAFLLPEDKGSPGAAPSGSASPAPAPAPAGSPRGADPATDELLSSYFKIRGENELEAGIALFRGKVARNPDSAITRILLGALLGAHGDLPAAHKEVEEGLDISGGRHPWAYGVLGDLALREGKPEEALRHFQDQAKTAPPGSLIVSQALTSEAYCLLWTQGRAAARTQLAQALAAQPVSPQAYVLQAILDLLDGQKEKAVEACRKITSGEGHQSPVVWSFLGSLLLDAGMPQEALDLSTEGLKRFPGHSGMRALRLRAYRDAWPQKGPEAVAEAAWEQILWGAQANHLAMWEKAFAKKEAGR